MKLAHEFSVPVEPEVAWATLTDLETTASCLPGASVDSIDGDDITGSVRLKIGPIGMTYRGAAKLTTDTATHTLVLDAQSTDTRGGSRANAVITARLERIDTGTRITVDTDLDITGKPAQFGSGVITEVGGRIIGQFADQLSARIQQVGAPVPAGVSAPTAATARSTSTAPAPASVPAAPALSVLSLLSPRARHEAALVGIGLLGLVVGWWARSSLSGRTFS
jgi:carbon monoxide dehydrogenase subunit G